MRKLMHNRRVSLVSHILLGMLAAVVAISGAFSITIPVKAADAEKTITIRVCNWEEYIDEGGWDDEEVIDLESGNIWGENPVYEDFCEWYFETYGVRVNVEYSCFGTNEELYNMLTLGDVYDLVCPSEYMIMKLMAEGQLEPFSEDFFDEDNAYNQYIRNVSPYIRNRFENTEINGEPWSKYAAGYMWGVTGILYNPEMVAEEEASSWSIIQNPKFNRQVTIKDNVRDSYFAALGAVRERELLDPDFLLREDYSKALEEVMNDVSPKTIAEVEAYLKKTKDNVYSFETDSGKADMITGKVLANYQWSGDAVYAMDQAEEDDLILNYAVPRESTNMWFDGWVMLKNGIAEDPAKKQVCEAFINFLSIPEIVVRNMYYIGYTSVIAGGDSNVVFDYVDWCYGAEEDEEDVVDYDLGYFFSEDEESEDYVLTIPKEQLKRQAFAQYPSEDVIARSAIMLYFDEEANAAINQMWINVRCFDMNKVPVWGYVLMGIVLVAVVVFAVRMKRKKIM